MERESGGDTRERVKTCGFKFSYSTKKHSLLDSRSRFNYRTECGVWNLDEKSGAGELSLVSR